MYKSFNFYANLLILVFSFLTALDYQEGLFLSV